MQGGTVPYGNLIAVPLSIAISILCGVLCSGSPTRRRVALLLCPLTLLPPFLVDPAVKGLRFFCALGPVVGIFRTLDLYGDERQWSVGRRVWLMVSIFDSREATFGDKAFDARSWGKALAFALPTAGGIWLLLHPPPVAGSGGWVLRWVAGAVFAYCSFEVLEALMRAGYKLGGIDVPRFHFHPIVSRTIAEFWGMRWNLVVHQMLKRHCFRPLARRGLATLGVAAAFVMSALIHAWLVIVAESPTMALWMGAFFALQGVLMVLEKRLEVHRWRPGLGHAWTVLWVLGTSPMFTEPFLRITVSGI